METQEKQSTLLGTYLVNGTMGNVGMPGAPICRFSLVVTPAAHAVSGTVEITQAIEGPNSHIVVTNVKGTIRPTGLGQYTQVVALEGEYVFNFPPPAIGSILEKFSAHMAIDNSWNGQGGFSYGQNVVNDVPVRSIDQH